MQEIPIENIMFYAFLNDLRERRENRFIIYKDNKKTLRKRIDLPPSITWSFTKAMNSNVTDKQYEKLVNSTISPKLKGMTDITTITHVKIEYVGVPYELLWLKILGIWARSDMPISCIESKKQRVWSKVCCKNCSDCQSSLGFVLHAHLHLSLNSMQLQCRWPPRQRSNYPAILPQSDFPQLQMSPPSSQIEVYPLHQLQLV